VITIPPQGAAGGLASTGVPVGQILLLGIGLTLLGCLLVGLTVRPGRRRRRTSP
jgi:hypothetical protein